MDSLNTFRAVLVGAAVVAIIVAAGFGRWQVVAYLSVGVAAHVGLWVWMHRNGGTQSEEERQRRTDRLARSDGF